MCAMQVNEFDSSDEEPLEEEQTPFQVSWLSLSPAYSQFLGISSLPGCRFKNIKRNLQKDIDELKSHGVLDVFVLCTKGELTKYRVPHLMETYQNYGITVHHHPIPDGGTPDIARCCVVLNELRNCLESKRKATIQLSSDILVIYLQVNESDSITKCSSATSVPKFDFFLLQSASAISFQNTDQRYIIFFCILSKRLQGCIEEPVSYSDSFDNFTIIKNTTIEYMITSYCEKAVVMEDLDDPVSQYNYLHDFQETLAAYLATESERPRSVSR